MNTQTPLGVDRSTDGSVFVHSVFNTIQGEGPFAGQAATFVRLFGCNLQCPGCDTDYTSFKDHAEVYALLDHINDYGRRPQLVVITGGEPFRQNISAIVRALLYDNAVMRRVQVETNGVFYPGDDFPWRHPRVVVVCSPKTPKIHPETAVRVHAYKYVLSHDSIATDGLPEMALAHPLGTFSRVARPPEGWEGPVYLQPMDAQDPDTNQRNIQACVDSVLQHRRYILGVQLHKLVDLP